MNDELARAIHSLNDVVAELMCGLAQGELPSKGYAYQVVDALAEHTREVGGQPLIDITAIPGWDDEQ